MAPSSFALTKTRKAIDPSLIAATTCEGAWDQLRQTPEARRAAWGLCGSLALLFLSAPATWGLVALCGACGAWVWLRTRGEGLVARLAQARVLGVVLWTAGPCVEIASLLGCAWACDGAEGRFAALALCAGSWCAWGDGRFGDDAWVAPALSYAAWALASGGGVRGGLGVVGLVGARYTVVGAKCGGHFGSHVAAAVKEALLDATRRAALAPLEDLSEDELLQASLLNAVAGLWGSPAPKGDGAQGGSDFNVVASVLEAVATFGAGAVGASLVALGALEHRLVDDHFDADETADWAETQVEALETALVPSPGTAETCRILSDAPHVAVAACLVLAAVASGDARRLAVAVSLAPLVMGDLRRLRDLRDSNADHRALVEAAVLDARAADLAAKRCPDSAHLAAAADDRAAMQRHFNTSGLEAVFREREAWHASTSPRSMLARPKNEWTRTEIRGFTNTCLTPRPAQADDLRCAALVARDGQGLRLLLRAPRKAQAFLGPDVAGLDEAFAYLRRVRVALGGRRCRVSLRTLQTSARVKTLAVGVARLSSATAAAYAAGGDGGTASALSLCLALANEARLLLTDSDSATRKVAKDAALVAANAARLWRETGAAEYVDDALFAPEHRTFWQWTAYYSTGATAGAIVGGLVAGPVGAAAGAALAGGSVKVASIALDDDADADADDAKLPPLPSPPPPDETDRWSDVDSDDDADGSAPPPAAQPPPPPADPTPLERERAPPVGEPAAADDADDAAAAEPRPSPGDQPDAPAGPDDLAPV